MGSVRNCYDIALAEIWSVTLKRELKFKDWVLNAGEYQESGIDYFEGFQTLVVWI